jgi:hypothetical protein
MNTHELSTFAVSWNEKETMSLNISLAQTIRVNLIWLVALAMLSFGPSPAAWAQSDNTVLGTNALSHNTTGGGDTALGFQALFSNTIGGANTATGGYALYSNTIGGGNTATGWAALEDNGAGAGNTATGTNALTNNGKGNQNTATGWNALLFSSGDDNTAIGTFALQENSSGGNNIAVGTGAGINLTTGSNNIDIGNPGVPGESNSIRIGTTGTQNATYIAGIFGATVTGGCAVVVESTGQIGCVSSSARYKRDVD